MNFRSPVLNAAEWNLFPYIYVSYTHVHCGGTVAPEHMKLIWHYTYWRKTLKRGSYFMDIVIVTVNENRKGFNVESITCHEKYVT